MLHKGTPTDRLVAQWWIREPHVERRVAPAQRRCRCGAANSPAPRQSTSPAPAEAWLANAESVLDRDERRLLLEIPMGFTDMQREAPELALEWRMQTREMFETYFRRGYRAVDFFLDRPHARGRYLLAKTEP